MKKILNYIIEAEIIFRYFRVLMALLCVGLSGYLYFYTEVEGMKEIVLFMIILLVITILQIGLFNEDKGKDILSLIDELDFDYLFKCIDYYDEDLYGSFYENTKSTLRSLEELKKK